MRRRTRQSMTAGPSTASRNEASRASVNLAQEAVDITGLDAEDLLWWSCRTASTTSRARSDRARRRRPCSDRHVRPPQEQPHVVCRSVDVSPGRAGGAQEQLAVDQVLAEATVPRPRTVVAYRGGRRWIQGFDPVRLGPVAAPTLCWRERGVYLIVGGLGRVGLLIAGHLARTVRARLVLVGLTPFPDRADCAQLADRARRRRPHVRSDTRADGAQGAGRGDHAHHRGCGR